MQSLYIAPNGCDGWSGLLAEPAVDGTDGPFATLERAREAVRALKRDGWSAGGVTVWLREGRYPRETTFALTAEDSGTGEAPVVWRAMPGEAVRLRGGRAVMGFRPVDDPAVLARFDPAARKHVLCADLAAQGISDFGSLRSRGFGRPVTPAHMELFFGDQPMTLARWPNEGFVQIAGFAEAADGGDGHGGTVGKLEAGFYYDGDRPRRWRDTGDSWVHGYWSWDWANSYERIASLDAETRLIRTQEPYGLYAFRAGQRYYYLNILEELDAPGEYFVDACAGLLYFWPPAPLDTGEVTVSVLETPLITLEDAAHVTLQGLTLECSRGSGIVVTGGAHVCIAGCTLRNLGNIAISIDGGSAHTVTGCDIYQVGDAGIRMSGGDFATLTPAGHVAHNNHVYRFAQWSRCYQGGISAYGVGNRISHNLIHDAPHTAIFIGGNDLVVEYNEIHHVTLETGDCGAIYGGRTWLRRGNLIRHNFIHHTGGMGMGSMGVYLDDQLSGHAIIGNVFQQVTRAAFIGGGCDNRVENNLFIDCAPAVHVDGRGMVGGPTWGKQVEKLKQEVNDTDPAVLALYRQRYPELATFDPYLHTDALMPPLGNIITRNVCRGGRWIDIIWGARPEYVQLGENLTDADPRLAPAPRGGFQLAEDSPAWSIGFERIPVEEIGLVRDEHRQRR